MIEVAAADSTPAWVRGFWLLKAEREIETHGLMRTRDADEDERRVRALAAHPDGRAIVDAYLARERDAELRALLQRIDAEGR